MASYHTAGLQCAWNPAFCYIVCSLLSAMHCIRHFRHCSNWRNEAAVTRRTSRAIHPGLGGAGLGWAGLGCAVLCCAVLCCAVLCCAVLCCAVLCCAVLSSCSTDSQSSHLPAIQKSALVQSCVHSAAEDQVQGQIPSKPRKEKA